MQIFSEDVNKFILLLRKGFILMNTWIAGKDLMIYHCLVKNLKDITDKDYSYAQKIFEEFELKNLGHYHDLYVQSDILLLADVFENFRNKCIEIYEIDPAHFLSGPRLVSPACLKRGKSRI